MDRQDELQQMLAVSAEYPETWDGAAMRKKIKRKAGMHYMAVTFRSVAVVFALLLSGLCIVVNTSESLAKELEEIPVLQKVVRWMNFHNAGYRESSDAGYAAQQDISLQGEKIKLTIPYVMADDSKLVLIYRKMSLVSGTEYYVVPEKIMNAETGKELEKLYASFGDGDSDGFEFYWDGFVKKVEVTFGVYPVSEDSASQEESLTVTINTGEKKAPREYAAVYDLTAGSQHYTIENVVMYPLTTAISLRIHDEEMGDDGITKYIAFYLTDGEIRRDSHMENTTIKADGDFWRVEMEGGYFAMKEQGVKLGISAVYLLPEDRRDLYLDMEKGCFYDAYGKDSMLQIIDSPEEDCIAVQFVTEDPNLEIYTYNLPFVFDGYEEEGAVNTAVTANGDVEKKTYLIKKSVLQPDEKGIVKCKRLYPADVITFGETGTEPVLEIPLQLK